ncbi:MucB/RseB C-terminal domain-containing protein [Dokdonella sp.]|uniref:MucB/RseB C-terminal domain-containing protein n=1 Tax=Dokdonella sp. TaxID=2291710 RepID=UPI002BA2F184|nr:MucB/RseB C-terminal domain-containing protein [Dokdonella sp.]HPN79749.1 MucB/RseB C-terminal domain-containing protein [Dokdonella sp.]
MKGFATRIVLSMVFALAGPVCAESADARAMLNQMSAAIRSLDYQGSFAYQHAGRVDTLRVFHAGGAVERERLISLNGPRSEVIRNGRNVTCIQPDGSATVYVNGSGRGLLPLVPDASSRPLGDQYDVSISGSDRVAGYLADIIDVTPRDAFRYGYRLWLDQGTRLLLRSTVLDSEKRVLEQFMFVSLEIGKLPDETELVPGQRELKTTAAAASDEAELRGASEWRVNKPPTGFALVSARRSGLAEKPTEHLVYSDGLASVSIYIEPRNENAADMTTMAGRGTLNIYTYTEGDLRYTVLGDVPVATVTAMARSIGRNTQPRAESR